MYSWSIDRLDKAYEEMYYAGFRAAKERKMFSSELEDLEYRYECEIEQNEAWQEHRLKALVPLLKAFLSVYDDNAALHDKLEVLRIKMKKEGDRE